MTEPEPAKPAFIFDLDGTLIDSVYQHVIAWREALEQASQASAAAYRALFKQPGFFEFYEQNPKNPGCLNSAR